MKLDPKALERAAHQHTQWNGNPKALGSILALGNTESIVTAYLTAIGETHVVVPREPVAWIGQGTIPIRADEYERLKERSPGEASVFTTPLYAAAKEGE